MRILCITNLFPNRYRPGKGIFNWHAFSQLAEQASVRVLSPIPWTEEIQFGKKAPTLHVAERWDDWKGVSVVYPRYFFTPRVLRGMYGKFFESSIRKTFEWAVADFQPDLVYACWAYPDAWAACRLASQFGLPVAVKLHGSDVLLVNQSADRKQRTVEVLKQADCLFAVSAHLRERAIELGAPNDRTHVVYEGVNTELFCPGDRASARKELGLPADGSRLLFVGNLIPLKGVTHLLDACERLMKDGVVLEADLLGDGPLRAALEREIGERQLTGRVHLRGWQPQHLLPQWYRAADLTVLPSYSEGVPNVLVETAACGRPFVATAVGGIPEIAHLSPAPLVAPGDAMQLAEAIRSVLADSGRTGVPFVRDRIPTVRAAAATMFETFSHVIAERQSVGSLKACVS
jgi:glycosyltransferase involved in cell wall biosynthesis